jgi:hypothetical protein
LAVSLEEEIVKEMSTEMVLKEDKPPKVAPGDQPIVAVVENTQPRVETV